MKTINKRLLVTSGLFVAFSALTSFNPFNEANHLSALAKEESLTLATSAVNRGTQRVDHGQTASVDAEFSRRKAAPAPAPAPQKKEDPKDSEEAKTQETADANKTAATAPCADGNCGEVQVSKAAESLSVDIQRAQEQIMTDPSLSNKEKAKRMAEIEEAGRQSSRKSIERSAIFCPGDYSGTREDFRERAKCYKDYSDGFKAQRKKPQIYEKFVTELSKFIEEIRASDLSASQANSVLRKMLRVAKDNRDKELVENIEVAIAAYKVDRETQVFAKNMERQIREFEMRQSAINNHGAFLQSMGLNPQQDMQFQNLIVAAKESQYNIEASFARLQHVYRQSLPKASDDESTVISSRRDELTDVYNSLVADIDPDGTLITDTRLTSLDTTVAFAPRTQSGVSMIGQNSINTFGPNSYNGNNNFMNGNQYAGSFDTWNMNRGNNITGGTPAFPNNLPRTGNNNMMIQNHNQPWNNNQYNNPGYANMQARPLT